MSKLDTPPKPWWRRLLSVGGIASVAVGALLWIGFTAALEYTNTTEFCISCHEMERTVYQEYKQSVHYTNPSGVRAECADCHVPKEFAPKIVRKVLAVNDVYHTILGSIDTPEKFADKRLDLAERVWAYMKASDSRECRSCHSFDAMNISKQAPRPQEKHPTAIKDGKTCLDCHMGVAHKLPPSDD